MLMLSSELGKLVLYATAMAQERGRAELGWWMWRRWWLGKQRSCMS